MLALKTQYRIVPKILTNDLGETFYVLFLVSECNGEISFKVLSARPYDTTSKVSEAFLLNGAVASTISFVTTLTLSFTEVFLPYIFNVLIQQSPRAPSFV